MTYPEIFFTILKMKKKKDGYPVRSNKCPKHATKKGKKKDKRLSVYSIIGVIAACRDM